jgi:hypothetical protein
MDKKPKVRRDLRKDRGGGEEKTQAERFIETAREIGVDETGKEFEGSLKKLVPPKRSA